MVVAKYGGQEISGLGIDFHKEWGRQCSYSVKKITTEILNYMNDHDTCIYPISHLSLKQREKLLHEIKATSYRAQREMDSGLEYVCVWKS